ncbi:carboxylesterase family protein [Croceibacterium sp. LX-88]|uniref:Carboxylic ester hydrolase n=1 Tax=Croceibacterium selenioxidans TaxID=2838833 RepID=A0ABS5W585_9SPHN|nr:carboxylesterase family protein [Croceibacterium selenioxidans]MBT2134458.1 carboxylesterase family protein [Croceibacterium selenioxidans]
MRRVLPFIALVAATCLTSPAFADDTSVTIESGALKGMSADGVLSWKGIPFAAPPVGDLRWRNPQPAAHWSGERKASAYGNDCMQVPFPSDAAPLGTPPAEDCLYANVWRPAGAKGKLPVVFWIYGGGFVNGGASPPTYSGAEMAKQGVVFVSANYRVGRFGTFAHPALTRANEDGGLLGNYGYMDQLAALQWVKRNIAAFGGDPDNVTIIGESAGGMSVHTLVTSPLAEGLFDKAVVMSGGDGGGMGGATLASTEEVGSNFAQKFGIAANDPQALAKLRALSAEQVTDGLSMMALFAPNGPRTFASPFADGKLAVDAGAAYRSGQFAHVPIMIGATSADIGGKTGPMIAGARTIETVIAGKGVPVYAYRFSYVAENPPPAPAGAPAQEGAGHASDIPFFFDTQAIKYEDRTTARDNAMGETISAYLVNFAKTGNPNGAGLPVWPTYDRSKDEIMDFAANGKAVPGKDPWGAELDAAAR